MENNALLTEVMTKAQVWLDGNYNEETKNDIHRMINADDKTEQDVKGKMVFTELGG